MATQVEVGSALASLASLREPANDAELPRVLVSPLSAAGGQPGELPGPLSPLRQEERGPFGNLSFKPATMTPATSRPRMTPKPFCREKSAETFAIVRPPVPALKPSNVAPKPSVFAQTLEDVSMARGLTGNVPPLVDQKLVESKASGDLVATMPFYSSPQANTVILFETGSTDRVRMTWTPGKDVVGVPRALSSTFPAQEGQRPPSESEASSRGIHRQQLPLSSESRLGSWNPCRPLGRTDAPEKEKAQEGEQQQPSSRSGPASEVPPRLKQRPVSSIFLESLKDQKCCAPDVPEEKGLPEKPWVRKPRPLSVDLTAKFESRDLSVPRKPCPLEAKEQSRADGGHGRPSEVAGAPKSVAAAGLGRGDCIADSSPGAKSVLHPPPAQLPSSCHSTPKESSPASAKDREDLWGRRRRSREEQPEREAALAAAASGRSQEPPRSKGRSAQDWTVLNPKETRLGAGDSSAHAAEAERRSVRGGGIQKLLSLPETSANGAALANPASLPESPEKEGRILNIQQRIKELTADNAGAKPGNLRRSFRSRPLSADLTKRFSSPATGSEGRLERQADPNRKPLGETREVPEKEASLPCGPDCREARVLGPPWNPQQLPTDGHLERQNMALQGEGPPPLAESPPVAAPESTALKTVRATLFEHSVQRHNVALDGLASEPASQPAPRHGGGRLGGGRELWPEESQPMARKVPSKQAAKPGPAKSFHEDPALAAATWEKYSTQEKLEQAATQKHIEDSLRHQRIEPRYEILQTVGERVQSEAVAAVSEDKAVTLRSRRSLKERRKSQEGLVAIPWPGSLGLKGRGWREDGPGEAAAVKTTSGKERRVSHSQITELSSSPTRPQQPVPAKASYVPSRKQDVGMTDDTVSSLSSEIEKEKPGVCFADHMEGYKIAKFGVESFGAGPGRVEYGYDTSANVGENNMAPGEAGQREGPSSALGGGSQWPKHRSQPSPPSVDTRRPSGQEGSQAVAFRTAGAAYCAKEEGDVSGRLVEGERFGPLDGGERIRRSGLGAAERWRRKTLPHGAARFEDAGALAQEGMRALSRRDSLQLQNRSAAKRTREPKCGAEPSQEGSRPAASPKQQQQQQQQQLSPSEPKAASGAVPAQGPAGHEPALDPLRSQPVSPVAENTWGSSASRRSHRHPHRRLADTPGSLDRHLSKSWAEGGTPGGSKPEPSDARGETWRALERRLDGAPERSATVCLPFQAAPTSPPCSRPFPQGRERGSSQGLAKGMGADGYRSRVLDIDALMAEYREDPRREGGLSEESSWFPWERLGCRRNSADKTSGSSNASSPRGLDSFPRSTRPGIPGTEFRWPETGHPSEPGKAESCGRDRAATFSPPHWGRLTAEKPTKYFPADLSSTRKKTFILDEEPGKSLVRRHPSAKHTSCARVDAEPGASGAPPPSQLLPGGVSRQGTGPKQHASAPLEEDCRQAAHATGLSKSSGAVGVEARAEGKSSAPGLANAPLDLRRTSSEKVRQARGRSSLPSGPEVREGLHPCPLPGRAEGWPGQRSASQQDSSFREEEEEKTQGPGSPEGGRSPPYLPVQRRSRSFYRERRTDRWAADQLKECFGRPAAEAKDTDTLVPEADSQYGTWSDQQRHSGDSFAPESPSSESHVASARKQPPGSRLSSFSSQTEQQDSARDQRSTSLDRSSTDVESADGTEGPAPAGACPDFSFLEHTPVLDSSALKTRVQLSKRRRQHRAPISHSLRRSPAGDVDHRLSAPQEVDSAWMFQDCTEAKSAKRGEEEEEEEETMRPVERSPSSQPQRLPVFPGMDHSVLKAQLRKRQDLEGPVEGHPAQLSKSPKSPFQARVLPTGVEKEERSEESSPQWLRELKSKKRQSQYENQV